jgi:hypothetical protein
VVREFRNLLFLAAVASSFCSGQRLQSRLTNRDIVELVSLGFSDGVILDKIQSTQAVDFDTSIQELKNLKQANVSDAVIRAMINARGMIAQARHQRVAFLRLLPACRVNLACI